VAFVAQKGSAARSLDHYHTGTMTGRIDGCSAVADGAYMELNPFDAAGYGIENINTADAKIRIWIKELFQCFPQMKLPPM
jgi:predicted molibdopterin-dependent oxidoreductase YjgC